MCHEVVEGAGEPHPAGDGGVLVPGGLVAGGIITVVVDGEQYEICYGEQEPHEGQHVGSNPARADLCGGERRSTGRQA